ncbi:MAG: glycosyltransferase [Flavobacteriales bacterium]|nr:MAG: glycosyltransferase [Flavobacteriales bacterium]
MAALRPGEPVLIVSHTFPPYRGIGGRRWAKLAKELARRGHPVHVVHADQGNELKGSLWDADVHHPLVRRYALPMRYPQVLMKRPLTSVVERIGYRFWMKVLPLIAHGNILDRSVRWALPLVAKCDALITQHGIKHVIATGPPFALLHHLLGLKHRPGVRLVADFRDPWTWGEVYGRSNMSAAQREAENKLEREVMAGYDGITTPSPFILHHLRTTYPQHAAKFSLLPHVIDPDELGPAAPTLEDGRFRMIYAGSVYNEPGFTAYFAEVLQAFQHVEHEVPERWRASSFDLFITGHDTTRWKRMAQEAGQSERIRFQQPLPAQQLFPLIQRADLVLAYMPPEKRDFVSTKFNELAWLGTPVLHIGEPGGLSEHITGKGLGRTVAVDGVADLLQRIIVGHEKVDSARTYRAEEHMLAAVCDQFIASLGN